MKIFRKRRIKYSKCFKKQQKSSCKKKKIEIFQEKTKYTKCSTKKQKSRQNFRRRAGVRQSTPEYHDFGNIAVLRNFITCYLKKGFVFLKRVNGPFLGGSVLKNKKNTFIPYCFSFFSPHDKTKISMVWTKMVKNIFIPCRNFIICMVRCFFP